VTIPAVSVVIPAYRAGAIIGPTIESALAQTMREVEVLVVDDCSPDDTVAVVEGYARADSRVRCLRHAANRGPGGARTTALEAARGRYVAFLDSDDVWLPEKLERQIAFMTGRGAALSYTQYRRIDQAGAIVSDVVGVPAMLDYQALLRNTAIATSTVVVDRAMTGPFTMQDVFYDDYVCWLALLKRGFIAHGLQEDLMRYRILARSWSRNKLRSAAQVWRIYRDVERLALVPAAWVFTQYAWNAFRKYRG
jgi:teichuronic acid biosynthesis glycosyltransferase TuaG